MWTWFCGHPCFLRFCVNLLPCNLKCFSALLSLLLFGMANYSDINPFKSSHSSWMLCSVILFFPLLSYGFDRLTLRPSRSACVLQVRPQALRPVLTAHPRPVYIPSPLLGMDFSVLFLLATTCFTSVLRMPGLVALPLVIKVFYSLQETGERTQAWLPGFAAVAAVVIVPFHQRQENQGCFLGSCLFPVFYVSHSMSTGKSFWVGAKTLCVCVSQWFLTQSLAITVFCWILLTSLQYHLLQIKKWLFNFI